jgi:hypothetical protein
VRIKAKTRWIIAACLVLLRRSEWWHGAAGCLLSSAELDAWELGLGGRESLPDLKFVL